MYKPTNRAMGMVQAMVKMPHDEPGTSCTQPSGNDRGLTRGSDNILGVRFRCGGSLHRRMLRGEFVGGSDGV